MENMTINQLCGQKLKEAREKKNMSIQDLAYAIAPEDYQKTIKLIKYWEKGNGYPDLNQIYKMAEILEIDPNVIFKLRESDRKKEGEKKQLSNWQVNLRRRIEANFDDFSLLLKPFLIVIILVLLLGNGPYGSSASALQIVINVITHPIASLKNVLSTIHNALQNW